MCGGVCEGKHPVVVCMPISDCIDVKKLFMEYKKIITYKIKMMPSFYLLL